MKYHWCAKLSRTSKSARSAFFVKVSPRKGIYCECHWNAANTTKVWLIKSPRWSVGKSFPYSYTYRHTVEYDSRVGCWFGAAKCQVSRSDWYGVFNVPSFQLKASYLRQANFPPKWPTIYNRTKPCYQLHTPFSPAMYAVLLLHNHASARGSLRNIGGIIIL